MEPEAKISLPCQSHFGQTFCHSNETVTNTETVTDRVTKMTSVLGGCGRGRGSRLQLSSIYVSIYRWSSDLITGITVNSFLRSVSVCQAVINLLSAELVAAVITIAFSPVAKQRD